MKKSLGYFLVSFPESSMFAFIVIEPISKHSFGFSIIKSLATLFTYIFTKVFIVIFYYQCYSFSFISLYVLLLILLWLLSALRVWRVMCPRNSSTFFLLMNYILYTHCSYIIIVIIVFILFLSTLLAI